MWGRGKLHAYAVYLWVLVSRSYLPSSSGTQQLFAVARDTPVLLVVSIEEEAKAALQSYLPSRRPRDETLAEGAALLTRFSRTPPMSKNLQR
jgi:hypothetical protein